MYTRAGIILYNTNDKILLVKGKQTQKWSFPKGRVEDNETVEQTALREFIEETGRTFNNKELCVAKFRHYNSHLFITKIESQDLPVISRVNEDEIEEIKWVSPYEVSDWELNSSLKAYINEFYKL